MKELKVRFRVSQIVAVQRAALRSGNLNIGSRLVCFRSISVLAHRGLLELSLNKNVLSVSDSSALLHREIIPSAVNSLDRISRADDINEVFAFS